MKLALSKTLILPKILVFDYLRLFLIEDLNQEKLDADNGYNENRNRKTRNFLSNNQH